MIGIFIYTIASNFSFTREAPIFKVAVAATNSPIDKYSPFL
jgi:hypothetical protein